MRKLRQYYFRLAGNKMKFKILHSSKTKKVDLFKYLIDWDHKVTRGGKMNFGQFQFNVKKLLHKHWKDDIVLEEMSVPAKIGEGGKSFDLVNITRSQIIEIQGNHHFKKGWMHKSNEDFKKQLSSDDFKMRWAELNNFQFFEIYQDDELNEKLLYELQIL